MMNIPNGQVLHLRQQPTRCPWKIKCVSSISGVLLVVILPYIHLGLVYSWWVPEKSAPNRHTCRCSCWDTIFKGSYQDGVSGYKHVYFNITSNTFKMWVLTISAAILVYEIMCYLTRVLMTYHLRLPMFLLIASILYPHYYSWWMYFNAWNDEFYLQWNHQTFFALTEVTSTAAILWLCDKRRAIRPRILLLVIDIAVLHILASGSDQFVTNVLMGKGMWHQTTRDLALMGPDILHVIIPALEIHFHLKKNNAKVGEIFTRWDILGSITVVGGLWLLCYYL